MLGDMHDSLLGFDLTGIAPRKDVVKAARAGMPSVVRNFERWRNVRREEYVQATGRSHIKLRWVGINKGDELHPKYTSRIAAKEITIDNRRKLFAEPHRWSSPRPSRLMIRDSSKACLFAPATRDIFIELPPEDAEPGMVGKLEKSLHGTQDAVFNSAEAYTKDLISMA